MNWELLGFLLFVVWKSRVMMIRKSRVMMILFRQRIKLITFHFGVVVVVGQKPVNSIIMLIILCAISVTYYYHR